jgi:hypothetical protein
MLSLTRPLLVESRPAETSATAAAMSRPMREEDAGGDDSPGGSDGEREREEGVREREREGGRDS